MQKQDERRRALKALVPTRLTARVAPYVEAIDAHRAAGVTWSEIAMAVGPQVGLDLSDGYLAGSRLQRAYASARIAITNGRYRVVQRPLPEPEIAVVTPTVKGKGWGFTPP